jgi:hypothetical protein
VVYLAISLATFIAAQIVMRVTRASRLNTADQLPAEQ